MTETAIFADDNVKLRETAMRLIKALGVEMAIFICRSNYWHGVLKIIEELDATAQTASSVHSVSFQRQPATVDHQHRGMDEVAIAA